MTTRRQTSGSDEIQYSKLLDSLCTETWQSRSAAHQSARNQRDNAGADEKRDSKGVDDKRDSIGADEKRESKGSDGKRLGPASSAEVHERRSARLRLGEGRQQRKSPVLAAFFSAPCKASGGGETTPSRNSASETLPDCFELKPSWARKVLTKFSLVVTCTCSSRLLLRLAVSARRS